MLGPSVFGITFVLPDWLAPRAFRRFWGLFANVKSPENIASASTVATKNVITGVRFIG